MRRSARISRWSAGLLLLGLASGCGGDAEAGDASPEREPGWTVDRPLYTDEQAEWGRELFVRNCTNCHETATFTDPSFLYGWGNGSIQALYSFVTREMPFNNPGQLESEEYLAILAHLLRINHMPAGDEELGAIGQDLGDIYLERSSFFD